MKYTTVKISEIAAHPTLRLDPGYWLKKKKKIRAKPQAASYKLDSYSMKDYIGYYEN